MKNSRIYHTTRFTPMIFPLLAPLAALLITMTATATEITTLNFELQALDLDTGTVSERDPAGVIAPAGADVLIAYHADRIPHAVVFPAGIQGVELAFVANVSFDGITMASIVDLTFSAEPVDLPLTPGDTVVVRTDSGAFYKLGNAWESADTVTFNYEPVQ